MPPLLEAALRRVSLHTTSDSGEAFASAISDSLAARLWQARRRASGADVPLPSACRPLRPRAFYPALCVSVSLSLASSLSLPSRSLSPLPVLRHLDQDGHGVGQVRQRVPQVRCPETDCGLISLVFRLGSLLHRGNAEKTASTTMSGTTPRLARPCCLA